MKEMNESNADAEEPKGIENAKNVSQNQIGKSIFYAESLTTGKCKHINTSTAVHRIALMLAAAAHTPNNEYENAKFNRIIRNDNNLSSFVMQALAAAIHYRLIEPTKTSARYRNENESLAVMEDGTMACRTLYKTQ